MVNEKISELTEREKIMLVKLYLTRYHKKLLFRNFTTLNGFYLELRELPISEAYIRQFLLKMKNRGVLVFHEFRETTELFFVNREEIIKLINTDILFNLYHEIIEDRYILLEK